MQPAACMHHARHPSIAWLTRPDAWQGSLVRTLEEVADVRSAEAADKARQLQQLRHELEQAAAEQTQLQVGPMGCH